MTAAEGMDVSEVAWRCIVEGCVRVTYDWSMTVQDASRFR